jgi:hypothetical protein
VNEDTKLDDIIGFYGTKGADYDAIHKEHYDRYGKVRRAASCGHGRTRCPGVVD